MLNTLSDGMQQLEEAVNRKNPAVFEQLSLEDTEADDALAGSYPDVCDAFAVKRRITCADVCDAFAVKKRMKALKKLCRSRAETRWVQVYKYVCVCSGASKRDYEALSYACMRP